MDWLLEFFLSLFLISRSDCWFWNVIVSLQEMSKFKLTCVAFKEKQQKLSEAFFFQVWRFREFESTPFMLKQFHFFPRLLLSTAIFLM